jgi:hypothetical protein
MAEGGADQPVSSEPITARLNEQEAEKRDNLKQLTRSLVRRIDYGAVFSYHDKDDNPSDSVIDTVEELFYLRRVQLAVELGTVDLEDYHSLSFKEDMLRESASGWEAKGFLRKEEDRRRRR